MKHKCWLAVALAIGLVGCATTGGSSDEKVALSASAKPETKAAITAAETASTAAKSAGFEWFWKDKSASKHLQDAIKAANSGDDAAAVKLAKQIELAGIQGQAQAEAAKTAGPKFAKSAAKPAPAAAAKPIKVAKSSQPEQKAVAKTDDKAEAKPEKTLAKAEQSADKPKKADKPEKSEKTDAKADTKQAAAPAPAASANGSKIYRSACAACHDSGVAGSPKLGDKAAWGPRIAAGNLYASALKGKGAMPAKGGNAALSDSDVKAAVDYMSAQGK